MDEPRRPPLSPSASQLSRPSRSSRPSTALWTPAQRRVVVAFVLIFCAVLLIRSLYHRAHISDPQPAVPARFHELADRIDPNMATWHELAVLPQLGEKRAKELVAYREDYLSRGQESIAFHRAEDLLRVKGMGAAMLETLRPYLTFPTTRRASTTSTSSPSI